MRAIVKRAWPLLVVVSFVAACGEDPFTDGLEDGVLATFNVEGETFRVWVTNDQTIQQIIDLRDGKSNASIPIGPIVRGPGSAAHNGPWSWHFDPEETQMAELTIEVCDGRPSFIEEDLDYWIDTVGQYCPWGAELINVDVRP